MRHHGRALVILIGVLAASSGCGGPGDRVRVSGKLLKGGTTYTPPGDQVVDVTFVAVELKDAAGKAVQGGDMYAAEVDPDDSTFEVPGPDRRGIPPGKYRVAVTQKLKREAYDAKKNQKTPPGQKPISRETDMLANRYGATTSPIIVQVSRSEDMTIDLDQATGSPKP